MSTCPPAAFRRRFPLCHEENPQDDTLLSVEKSFDERKKSGRSKGGILIRWGWEISRDDDDDEGSMTKVFNVRATDDLLFESC